MAKDINTLRQEAQQVQNATQVGENTAQRVGGVLTDLVDNFEELASKLGSTAISFKMSANFNHSSAIDQIKINGKQGEIIEVTTIANIGNGEVAVAFWGYKDDGTNYQIGSALLGKTKEIILNSDYSKIGVYVEASSYSITVTFSAKFAITKKVDVLEKSISKLQNEQLLLAYFTNASKLTFNFLEDNSVVVTLPVVGSSFRVYDRKGNIVTSAVMSESNRVHTVGLYQALVIDKDTGTLEVVEFIGATQSANVLVLLLNKSAGICDGLFSEYFQKFLEQRNIWTIQDAMSDNTDNITVQTGAITINKGFSLINGINRYPIECTNAFVIKPLDDPNGTRVVRTFVYIDTFVITTSGTFLDGENAKDVFVYTQNPKTNSDGRYLLFATFYYQTPSGGLIDVYRGKVNASVARLYADKVTARNQCAFRSDFNCLFFSDIHGSTTNMNRIVELANNWGSGYVHAILNGGDIATNQVTDGYDWYNQLVDKSSIDVLAAAGNHDEWIDSNWNWADSSIVYNAVIAPIVAKVEGLVQPTDAATEGKLYYYKDYNKVRIIVLETTASGLSNVYWDSAQNTWMQEVLEDARVNNIAVICLTHVPFGKNDGEIDKSITFNCWTGYIQDVVDDKSTIQHDNLHVVDAALTNIDTFIDNGGKFICWLAGHTHQDYFVKSVSHPKQIMFVSASANYGRGSDYIVSGDKSNPLYDCMTYISIDLDKMWLKLLRIGKNIDGYMREKNVLVYDLTNQKVVTNY